MLSERGLRKKEIEMALITCDRVAFAYENQLVVSDLSFQVQEGDYLCIVGENGTGKTTLVKGLLGFKKASAGRIVMEEGLRQNEIGYVPQQSSVQKDFPASVQEVVLSGCLNSRGLRPGFGSREKKRAQESMELLGVDGLKGKSFRELSGGQKQRVLLARSLCATKKLLLLDEPVTGLDPVAAEEFYRALQSLNREQGIAVIMVSHDVREALRNADHILHLSQRSSFFGTVEAYRNSPLGRQFLGGIPDV